MVGKKFTDLRNGKVVEVTDRFDDIAILDGSKKIKVNQLLNTDHFDEYIDPKNFFRNESLLNNFAQKIKQIPDDVIKKIKDESLITENNTENIKTKKLKLKDPMTPFIDEPAILPADPEMEKLELMKKYGITQDPILDAQRQLEKFKSLLQEPDEDEEVQTFEVDREEEIENDEFEEDYERDEDEEIIEEIRRRPIKKEIKKKTEKSDDPIIAMFKNVKRNRDFKVTIDYQNMIPRADFIEMMEDSYNTSIIEFLADEFTNQILENPNLIRDKIVQEIKKVVYNKIESVVISENNKIEENLIKKNITLETKIVEKPKKGRRKKEELENDRSTVN